MKARYDFVPAQPIQIEVFEPGQNGQDQERARAVQRAHQRASGRHAPGRLLRSRDRRDGTGRGAVQLGQRAVARARARLRDPALEEPRPALVHRRPLRVRDDRAPPRVAARDGSRALRRAHARPHPGLGEHEPRLHARRERRGHHRRVLRGVADDGLHRRAVRHAEGRQGAPALGPEPDDRGRDPERVRRERGRVRQALPRVAAQTARSLQGPVHPRHADDEDARSGEGRRPEEPERRQRARRSHDRVRARRGRAERASDARPSAQGRPEELPRALPRLPLREGPGRRRSSRSPRFKPPAATATSFARSSRCSPRRRRTRTSTRSSSRRPTASTRRRSSRSAACSTSRRTTTARPTSSTSCASTRCSISTTRRCGAGCSSASSTTRSGTKRRRVGEGAVFVAVYDEHVHTNYGKALAAHGEHDRAVVRVRERAPLRAERRRRGDRARPRGRRRSSRSRRTPRRRRTWTKPSASTRTTPRSRT